MGLFNAKEEEEEEEEEEEWQECQDRVRERRKPFMEIQGEDDEKAERLARIQHLGGEYFIWEDTSRRGHAKGIGRVSCPPVETQEGVMWTNSREVWRQAMEEKEGKHNSSRQEAIHRQLDIRECGINPEVAKGVNWVEAGCPANNRAIPIRPEQTGEEILYVDKQGLYWDETSGKQLDQEEVIKARMEEMQYVREHEVYVKVPIQEWHDNTGKAPIRTRWLDINKGDEVNRNKGVG